MRWRLQLSGVVEALDVQVVNMAVTTATATSTTSSSTTIRTTQLQLQVQVTAGAREHRPRPAWHLLPRRNQAGGGVSGATEAHRRRIKYQPRPLPKALAALLVPVRSGRAQW